MLEKMKEFVKRTWSLEEKILLLADVLLVGVLLGWLTSPFKGGLFSNNIIGSQNSETYEEEVLDEEEGE